MGLSYFLYFVVKPESMKTEDEFVIYWNDFLKFNEYSQVKLYRQNEEHLKMLYNYLSARINKELTEELKRYNETISKASFSK